MGCSNILFLMSDFSLSMLTEFIKSFATNYKDVFSLPMVTVPSSVLAIYLANLLLKAKDSQKERKETAILFINTINSHITNLSDINLHVSSGHKKIKD